MKKYIKTTTLTLITLLLANVAWAQQTPPFWAAPSARQTEIKTTYLSPERIVYVSDNALVKNADALLLRNTGQADQGGGSFMKLANNGTDKGVIVLDFGRELQGGVQIVTTQGNKNPAGKVRIRFGESVGEALSDVGVSGSTNDHAIRDQVITLPWLGVHETGNSGFRFVSLEAVEANTEIEIKEVNAIFKYRDIPYLGSFQCDDQRLNDIWLTGAYTVHLTMQDYLWDGIKRDRLVWVGDLHPEVMTVNTVFGYNEVVPKSLDMIRDLTPLPNYMNGSVSYSLWWILIQRDWYYSHGNLEYLREQQSYLSALLKHFATKIDKSGKEMLDGWRFLDWPSSGNEAAIHAGLQSLMVLSFKAGIDMCDALRDNETKAVCEEALKKLKKYTPPLPKDSKQATSLMALAGIISPAKANKEVLARNGVHGMSTFYGYYMLQARGEAGDVSGALENISEYWGGMLDLGATTFWEDFDIKWKENAARIDQVTPEGKIDVHATYGDHCYVGYRHSFCHGWASGPTAFLSKYVLGIIPLEPGCRKVMIKPNLGNLQWAEGTYPTPQGVIKVSHKKGADGKVISTIDAPHGIEIVR